MGLSYRIRAWGLRGSRFWPGICSRGRRRPAVKHLPDRDNENIRLCPDNKGGTSRFRKKFRFRDFFVALFRGLRFVFY